MMSSTSRRARAERIWREVMLTEPPNRPSLYRAHGQLDQLFAEIWSRDGLPRADRRLITITCLAARGAAGPLHEHVRAALASGDLSVDELMEVVLQFSAYGGHARAELFDDTLWAAADELGLSPSGSVDIDGPNWGSDEERLATANEVFPLVMAMTGPRPMPDDDLVTRAGTMPIVFAEIWARGGITRRQRRIVSLTCAAMSGVERGAMGHWNMAVEHGDLTVSERHEWELHFAMYAGWPQAAPWVSPSVAEE